MVAKSSRKLHFSYKERLIYCINTSFKELVYAEVFQTFASRLFLTLSVLNFQIERKRGLSIGYSANFVWQIYGIFGD